MNVTPSPLTAAVAGACSAFALPLLRKWMGHESGLSASFILAMVVTVALPAQALVVGLRSGQDAGAQKLDTTLLKRIGAWLLAAAVVTGLRSALQCAPMPRRPMTFAAQVG